MAEILSDVAKKEMLRLRRLYDTPEGREEIVRLIIENSLFDTIRPTDPGRDEMLIKRNMVIELLYGLGILVDRNIPEIVDRLMNISYTEGV